MNNKRRALIAAALLVIMGVVAVFPLAVNTTEARGGDTAAACRPCETWGSIKTCFSPTPAACCSCKKNIKQE